MKEQLNTLTAGTVFYFGDNKDRLYIVTINQDNYFNYASYPTSKADLDEDINYNDIKGNKPSTCPGNLVTVV